ncbi:Protein NRT1/ PTR FAMILY 6.3 [Bienertia sinuspersici]
MSLAITNDDAGKTLDDAWDYKGHPANRSKTGVETCERMITLGIAFNLVTYLTGVMHLGNATSANTVPTSLGVTILTISTIVPNLRPPSCPENSSTCIQANGTQLGVLHLALYLTALGTGGLKSSVSGFGSDQFDDKDKDERSMMTTFFNWFYFIVSFGSLAAVTVLVYIEDNMGRQWGYGICACAIVVCVIVFLYGTKRYRFKKLVGSPLTEIAAVVVAAWRKRNVELPTDSSQLFNIDEVAETSFKKKQKLPHSKQFRFLDKAAIKTPEMSEDLSRVSKWNLATLTDVEEVKMIVRMLPIWATTIEFWTIHAQMTTFSVSQATTMDRHIGSKFEIPPASMTAFLVASILLTVPIYDRIVAPIAAKLFKNPQGLSPLQRVGVGLSLATIAMVVAAVTEIRRLHMAESYGLVNSPNAVLPMTVFWLIPQFILTGAGEAMIYAGQLDFFLRECPKGMKTMSTGLFLSTLSLGFFFSTVIVSLVNSATAHSKPWLADNLNQGKLYNFYWLLGIISLVNLILFLFCANWYVYKEKWLAAQGFEVELEETPGISCH